MKAELAFDEIRKLIKRNEKDNRVKTLVFVFAGIAVVVGVIVFILLKLRDDSKYDYDDWSELDDMDYDDYDYDDYDYEEESDDEALESENE